MEIIIIAISVISVGLCSAFFIFVTYYLYYDKLSFEPDRKKHYENDRKKYYKKRNKLGSVIMPITPTTKGIEKASLMQATEDLNKGINRQGYRVDDIQSITTSIGIDEICYITVWIRSKEYYLRKPKPKITEGFKV